MRTRTKLVGAGTAILAVWSALADTALHSTEYYAGAYDRDHGCKSLALLSNDDSEFVLRLHNCEFRLADALPSSNVGHDTLEEFKTTRIGTANVNDIGQRKLFVMALGAVDAKVVSTAAPVPESFSCRAGDDLATIVTMEENTQAGIEGVHLGISVIQLSNNGDWAADYNRGFEVAGLFKSTTWPKSPPKISCAD